MNLSEDKLNNLSLAALLFDVGKFMIDEEIMKKPSSLTDEEYEKVKKILNKLYNCEFVGKDEYLDINFFTGIEIEGILKLVKWLFLEQDVTYWNYSGRAMLYQSLKGNGLL